MSYFNRAELSEIVGKTIKRVYLSNTGDDILALEFKEDDRTFVFGHWQDCCESVWLEEGEEDLMELIGSTILSAEEEVGESEEDESGWSYQTWTFYKIQTTTGFCTLRFVGESNGYYSESVDLYWRD